MSELQPDPATGSHAGVSPDRPAADTRQNQPDGSVTASFPPAAKATALVVALVVAFHAAMTVVYNTPFAELRNRVLPGAVADAYIEPFFQQDYRIFAPNPISEDRYLLVRAWLRAPGETTRTTEWVNVTAAEISTTQRRLLRKQLTILGVERLVPAFRALSSEQQQIADENWHQSGFTGLRRALLEATPGTDQAVDRFILASEYVTAYGTQAAFAMWGEEDVVAVQVQAVYAPVVRWGERQDPDAARPASTIVNPGWRPPVVLEGQDSEKFAEIFLEMLDG